MTTKDYCFLRFFFFCNNLTLPNTDRLPRRLWIFIVRQNSIFWKLDLSLTLVHFNTILVIVRRVYGLFFLHLCIKWRWFSLMSNHCVLQTLLPRMLDMNAGRHKHGNWKKRIFSALVWSLKFQYKYMYFFSLNISYNISDAKLIKETFYKILVSKFKIPYICLRKKNFLESCVFSVQSYTFEDSALRNTDIHWHLAK